MIRARSRGALYIARPHGTRLQHSGEAAAAVTGRRGRPRRFPHVRLVLGGWLPPHAIPARCPRFGAGGLVVRSCAGPSQALAPVRRVEGGSHAADQARGPNRTARPVRLRGGSMAGTEWASEIRVVNASDTLRFCVRVVPWGLYCTAGLEVSPVVFLPPWLGSGDGIGGRVRRPVVRTC